MRRIIIHVPSADGTRRAVADRNDSDFSVGHAVSPSVVDAAAAAAAAAVRSSVVVGMYNNYGYYRRRPWRRTSADKFRYRFTAGVLSDLPVFSDVYNAGASGFNDNNTPRRMFIKYYA